MVRASPGSSSRTQVLSTEPNNSAKPCARSTPRGPEALISAAASIHCCERTAKPLSARASGAQQRAYRLAMRRQYFEPPHQHVEQPLARRLLGRVAQIRGEHGAVDRLDV